MWPSKRKEKYYGNFKEWSGSTLFYPRRKRGSHPVRVVVKENVDFQIREPRCRECAASLRASGPNTEPSRSHVSLLDMARYLSFELLDEGSFVVIVSFYITTVYASVCAMLQIFPFRTRGFVNW